jgi:hypothetical protein
VGGNAAGDKLTGIQNITGTDHNDTFFASSLGNAFDGGNHDLNGADTVSYANDTSGVGVSVDLDNGARTGGAAAGDTYTNIQNVIGTAFADTFVDGAGANRSGPGHCGLQQIGCGRESQLRNGPRRSRLCRGRQLHQHSERGRQQLR